MATKKRVRKQNREGLTAFELFDMIPDEDAAHEFLCRMRWGENHEHRHCSHCGGTSTRPSKRKYTFWCPDCKHRFSVRTDSVLEHTRMPLRKWVVALYLVVTNLKGVSSMKLARELSVGQNTAWFVLHRIRRALADDDAGKFFGPVEVDETWVGGKRRWLSHKKRKEMGRNWQKNKVQLAGVYDRETRHVRAATVQTADTVTMNEFIDARVAPEADVYTDDAHAYKFRSTDSVTHSRGEYVRDEAHTQGIESFWSMFKRGYRGVYHHMSHKHLDRYAAEFAGRKCIRELDTLDQMESVVKAGVGRRLTYKELTE